MAPADMGGFGGRPFLGTDMGAFAPAGSLRVGSGLRGFIQDRRGPGIGYIGLGNTSPSKPGSFSKHFIAADVWGMANFVTARQRDGVSSHGNAATGYMFAGYTTQLTDKIAYSSDTISTAANVITSGGNKRYGAATGHHTIAWIAGGIGNAYVNGTTTKYLMSSDTTAAGASASSTVMTAQLLASVTNLTAGYWAGGFSSISQIGKVTFASDTYATSGAVLGTGRGRLSGTGNTTEGHFAGGTDGAGTYVGAHDKLDYSSETISAGLSMPSVAGGTFAYSTSTDGFFAGGSDASNILLVNRALKFESGAWNTSGAALNPGRNYGGSLCTTHGGLGL